MKFLNATKRSRLKMAIYTSIFLGGSGLYAVHLGQESVAITCFAGILTICTTYLGSEGYNPSIKKKQ